MLESLFNKVTGLKACNFIKKKLRYRCSPVNVAKFLRTPFLRTPPVAASKNQRDVRLLLVTFNPLQTCVAFQIEISHLICSAK